MNRVILIGNVGNDPTIKTFENGDKQAQFSLATNKTWKNDKGEKQSKTQWHNIVVNGTKRVDVVEKFIHKGDKLAIEGELSYRSYEKSDGGNEPTKVYITEIKTNNFEFLTNTTKSDQPHPNAQPTNPKDDLPF